MLRYIYRIIYAKLSLLYCISVFKLYSIGYAGIVDFSSPFVCPWKLSQFHRSLGREVGRGRGGGEEGRSPRVMRQNQPRKVNGQQHWRRRG